MARRLLVVVGWCLVCAVTRVSCVSSDTSLVSSDTSLEWAVTPSHVWAVIHLVVTHWLTPYVGSDTSLVCTVTRLLCEQ